MAFVPSTYVPSRTNRIPAASGRIAQRPRQGHMARRTALKAWDKRLLERIRRGKWTAEELQWVLTHLDAQTPTLVMQEIHAKLIDVQGQPHTT
jgi:hypothetical protein